MIGCGGAGKTTLANMLGSKLSLPVIHGDELRAGWESIHADLVARDEWVIDAMRLGTLDERLARADTVIFVDRRTVACLVGIVARRLRYRGRSADGVVDVINPEFVRWIVGFRRTHRPRVLAALNRHRGTTRVVVVRTAREARMLVDSLGTAATSPAGESVRG